MKQSFRPKRILMLKTHSAGIGDVLRNSAAWRVLKNAYPEAELHLILLTREPGYPSEDLIRDHYLLNSFTAIDKRTHNWTQWRRFWNEVKRVTDHIKPDLVIDFEMNGLRTTWVADRCRFRFDSRTVGVKSVPGRNLFYGTSTVSPDKYALQRGLPLPLEYTEKDFVSLSALGLARNGGAIELKETADGRKARLAFFQEHGVDESVPLIGLNLGCGTHNSWTKRPKVEIYHELVAGLQRDFGMRLVILGAPYEQEVNKKFCARQIELSGKPIINLVGKTNISGLTGIINSLTLFITSDGGPFHMGVALRAPTLGVFTFENRTHFHVHPWVRCCIATSTQDVPALRKAAAELLAWGAAHPKDSRFSASPV